MSSGERIWTRTPWSVTSWVRVAARVRYLFLQERIRPYLGIQLSSLVLITRPEVQYFFGPGAMGGVDFYFTDFLSLGVRQRRPPGEKPMARPPASPMLGALVPGLPVASRLSSP